MQPSTDGNSSRSLRPQVILGLGSNCGDRLSYLRSAIHFLRSSWYSPRIQVFAISPIYESDALLPPHAPDSWNQPFLNVNLQCESDLPPLELLKHLKTIENQVGRVPRERWSPREIDIDILAIDSLVLNYENLKIPHPSLLDRPFALLPFADLKPDWRYPLLGNHLNQPISDIVLKWKARPSQEIPFRTRRSTLTFTQAVEIINLTPDSFSDGGLYPNFETVLNKVRGSISQGITIFDVGAESTRPHAQPISPQEEWHRLQPVLKALQLEKSHSHPLQVSLDTRHSEVVAKALDFQIDWINDVTGFSNSEMQRIAAGSHVQLVFMHSITIPHQPNAVIPPDVSPIQFLLEWCEKRIGELEKQGISRNRFIFDPGIGFGKTPQQTWEILRHVHKFYELGVKILIGHSRKSFLSSITSHPAPERDVETLALSLDLAAKGVDFLRVHSGEKHVRALKAWSQVNGVVQWQHPLT